MGVYISAVTINDWAGPLLKVGSALDLALAERDLPLFMPDPDATGQHSSFEERLTPAMDTLEELFLREVRDDRLRRSLDWDMIIPIEFDEPIVPPEPSSDNDTTTIRSSHRPPNSQRPTRWPPSCRDLRLSVTHRATPPPVNRNNPPTEPPPGHRAGRAVPIAQPPAQRDRTR